MRKMIIWILSILLGFEPALLAAGTKTNSEIKAFLENSQITLRSMTVNELYSRTSKDLPDSVRADFETFISQYGNARLPKFDVNKVAGANGEEHYQIQAVQEGKALSLTFILGKEVFMKLNGTNFSWTEMSDVRHVMAKAGLSTKEIKESFPSRKPANSDKILSADQILRLNMDQRKIYFKQFRDLLESMDAVEKALGHKKPSSQYFQAFPKRAQQVFQLWIGNPARANESSQEVEACLKSGFLVHREGTVRSSDETKVTTTFTEIACNPKDPQVRAKYEDLKKEAEIQIQNAQTLCSPNIGSPEKKKDATLEARCENFKNKNEKILKFGCKDQQLIGEYSICKDPRLESPPLVPEPEKPIVEESSTPISVPVPGTMQKCSEEPKEDHLSLKEGDCDLSESQGVVDTREWLCLDKNGMTSRRHVYLCKCQNGGQIIGKMKCSGGAKADPFEEKRTPGAKKAKPFNWVPLAVIGGLVGLTYWAISSSNKEKRKQQMPETQRPPIDVPAVPSKEKINPPSPRPVKKKKAVVLPLSTPTKKPGSTH